jgi:hypothetical protein
MQMPTHAEYLHVSENVIPPSKSRLHRRRTREEVEDEIVDKYVYEKRSEGPECPSGEDENGSHHED